MRIVELEDVGGNGDKGSQHTQTANRENVV